MDTEFGAVKQEETRKLTEEIPSEGGLAVLEILK